MSTRIRLRRDTAANWTSANPTLTTGEMGYETDTGKFKIGNNTNAWTALPYSITAELSEGNLNDLKDVTITSAANGDFLRWNGTAWINDAVDLSTDTVGSYVASLVEGTGITITNNSGEGATPTVALNATLDNLTDAVITSPLQFQGLMYDGTNWVNSNTPDVYLVRNNTGSTIPKGTLVGAVGAEPSGRIDVAPFQVTGTQNSELRAMGIATSNISSGANGEVMSFGTLTGLDTRGSTASALAVGDETWAANDILFAHPTVDGKLTNVRPQHDLAVALITVRHASTGQIAIRIIPGNNHLEWMHDVSLVDKTSGDFLKYNGTLWVNDQINLGTDTVGNYMSDLTQGTGVTITHTPGEGSNATIAIGQSVATTDSPTFAGLTVNGSSVVFEGATANEFETTLTVTDPTADRTITIPDATGTVAVSGTTPSFTQVTLSNAPTESSHAVTKQYADGIAAGINWHESVKLATATALSGTPTYDNGTSGLGATLTATANARLSVDGTPVTTNDRILVKDQVNAVHNGIYKVTDQGSAGAPYVLTRAVDQDGVSDNVVRGDATYVASGSVNGNQGFLISSSGTSGENLLHVVGTDSITFTQFTGVANITAGTGVTKSGNTLSIGQSVGTTDNVTFGTVTASLTGNASTATTLATARNIAGQPFNGSANISIAPTDLTGVTSSAAELNILDGATLSTTELNYVDGVTSAIQTQLDAKAPLASPTFTGTVSLPNGTIFNADINASAAIDKTKISGTAITAGDTGTVTSAMIAEGTIVNGDISSTAAIAVSKLAGGSAAQILITNTSGTPIFFTPSGDVTMDTTGQFTIAANAVTLGTDTTGDYVASLVAGTGVTLSNNMGESATPTIAIGQAVGTSSNVTFNDVTVSGNLTVSGTTTSINTTTLNVADNIVILNNDVTGSPTENAGIEVERGTSANVLVRWNETTDKWEATNDGSTYGNIVTSADSGTVTSTMIADGTIVNTDISSSAAIELGKLVSGTSAQVIIADGGGTPRYNTIGGDVTISNSGIVSIASGVIVNADVSTTAAIDLNKLADISTNAQTASYTLVLADKNKVVEMNVGSGNTLTVPPNSSVAFPVGTQIRVLQTNTGQCTLTAGAGVTVNGTPGLKLRTQWSSATLLKRATDTWVALGDLSA